MKKFFIPACLVLIALFTAGQALAQTRPTLAGQSQSGQGIIDFLDETALKGGLTADPKTETDVFGLIAGIVNVVLSLIGIIFFALTFYHGFRWMTAGGAEDTIKEAKTGIKQSLIGITIVLSSFVLTNFVLNRLNILNPALAPVDRPNVPVGESAPVGLD